MGWGIVKFKKLIHDYVKHFPLNIFLLNLYLFIVKLLKAIVS